MHFPCVTEPPKSIKIIQNNAEVRQGAQITVVDGQVIINGQIISVYRGAKKVPWGRGVRNKWMHKSLNECMTSL